MLTAYLVLVALVGLERIAELLVSKRNIAWSVERGAVERGFGHYPFMVVLHTGLLIACVVEVLVADRPFVQWLGWPMLALVVVAQSLRWWCISTLGRRWNTRIFVIPGLPLVASGPYRYLKHPNYIAVVVEGFALPLVHSAWVTAIAFTIINGGLLLVRIRAENSALAELAQ